MPGRRAILDRVLGARGEVLWVISGQSIAALCALLGMRYLTVYLPPAEYGVLALALTLGSLMQQIVFGPVSNAVLRFYAASATRRELRTMLRGAAVLFLWATAGLTVLAAVGAATHRVRPGSPAAGMIVAAALFAFVSGVNGALAAAHSAARRRSVVAAHQALAELLRFALAIAAVRLAGSSSLAALTGFVTGIGLCASSQGVLLWRAVRHEPRRAADPATIGESRARWRGELARYARPFAIWGGFTWAVLAADRWALQAFQSTADVGRYAALFQLGSYPITMGASMMVQLAAPVLFARAADASDLERRGESRHLNRILTALVLLATLVATLLAALLHRVIFAALVGESYRSVSWMLPAVVLGAGLFAAGQQLALTLQSDLRVERLVAPKIGSAVVGIILYFAGSRWGGMPGVVGAGVAFAAVHLAWVAVASRSVRGPVIGPPPDLAGATAPEASGDVLRAPP